MKNFNFYNPTKVYFGKGEVDKVFVTGCLSERYKPDLEKDIPLERKWTVEQVQKTQLCKQPDVLLTMFLMRNRFTSREKEKNYRFYEPRTVHGSSLSPAIHSILACDIGDMPQAYDYYLWASRLDLDNRNNNTEEGLHISSMAATWLNIVCGFGGLDYTGDVLAFRPIRPEAWKKYSFRLSYRDRILHVSIDGEVVKFQVLSGEDVDVKVYGRSLRLSREEQCVALEDFGTNSVKGVEDAD